MIDFANRRLLTPFTHPDSGITVHLLTRGETGGQEPLFLSLDYSSRSAAAASSASSACAKYSCHVHTQPAVRSRSHVVSAIASRCRAGIRYAVRKRTRPRRPERSYQRTLR